MNDLGRLLRNSDPQAAREWYERGAAADDPRAMLSLGRQLEDTDPQAAREWHERAAAGHPGATNKPFGIQAAQHHPPRRFAGHGRLSRDGESMGCFAPLSPVSDGCSYGSRSAQTPFSIPRLALSAGRPG